MKSLRSSFAGKNRLALSACASLGLLAGSLFGTPVPANLGNGLDKLVESNLVLKGRIEIVNGEIRVIDNSKARSSKAKARGEFNGFATQEAANYGALALREADSDRLLVRINFDGRVPIETLRERFAKQLTSVTVTAVDSSYRGVGVANAYVSLDEVVTLAQMEGVRSVILELRPQTRQRATSDDQEKSPAQPSAAPSPGQVFRVLGTAFDQGVTQHRVTAINRFYNQLTTGPDYQGNGLSIAALSNSFAANAAFPASADVASNDLPGNAGNPAGNTTPVFVLQDDLSDNMSDDEGRGMCQILYKMAPKAKIGFATAFSGEVGFANNIRGLANLPGFGQSGQTFAADVICDDVGYFDEPFFQDGIIALGIEDVAAAGVSYFSSAGNSTGNNGYDSDLRWVANGTGLTSATNTALAGTNINLANVPTDYYAGGFHNFNPAAGQLDVAQRVNIQTNANEPPTILQWNEPYDQNAAPNYVLPAIFTASNTYTGTAQNYTIPATLTAGVLYELQERATAGSSFDAIITLRDPNGNAIVLNQDTQIDENVRFFAPVTGSGYTIQVTAFGGTTGGYTLALFTTTGFSGPGVLTKIRLLAFTTAGAYVPTSSLVADTFATNQPIQLGTTLRSGGSQLQYVICRANVPSGANVATRVRYAIPGNGLSGVGPDEYVTYAGTVTGGHATSPNCNGVAAYEVFKPNVPEYYTSPGPATFYYDRNSNRLATPDIRFKPTIAAADGANMSVNEGNAGLGSDVNSDVDANPQFYGTSAASPHAAAIALLVLESKGGSRSVTPAQMTSILTRSTYAHDLDPYFSSGSGRTTNGGKVTISINSDNSANTTTGRNDPNSFAISYVGSGQVTSVVFNPQGTAATGGAVTSGQNGLDATNAYFKSDTPGLYFATSGTGGRAFTVGPASVGAFVAGTNVTAALSNPTVTPGPPGNNQTLTLTFTNGIFTGGNVLRFTIGRGLQRDNRVPVGPAAATTANYSADLFGGGVLIPEGTIINAGMSFSGTISDGSTFSGVVTNRIGQGFSRLDGFGFLNAEQAVTAPIQ